MTKQQEAEEVALVIRQAANIIDLANRKMEEYGLNLENYPEGWTDLNEHSSELRNIMVSDFDSDSGVQVMVGEVKHD